MYYPTLEQVESLSDKGNLIPIYREINADLETPVSAYLKVAKPPYSFLFESVEGGDRIARYSFIGTEPMKVIKTGENQPDGAIDPLIPVSDELSKFKMIPLEDQQRFNGGAVGYLAYEAVNYFEQLPSPNSDILNLPESVFMLTTTFLIFDHLRHRIRVVSHAHLNGNVKQSYNEAINRIDDLVNRLTKPVKMPRNNQADSVNKNSKLQSNITKKRYAEMVRKCKQYIVEGDNIQTVISQRLSRPTSAHPFQIYRTLRAINPSAYMYYMELNDFHIVGASPELLVQVEDGVVATHPIAGTRRRGVDNVEDLALEKELRTNEKERAEHVMLVDLGRNDIGRVSEPGTVKVTQFMDVERYSHVMHLVSHVTGKLRDDTTNYDALRACFPSGTVSGAPKVRAMEIIAELEPDKRGPYTGAVGYFDFKGNMDTAITIRTLIIKDGIAYAPAGGGIVFDSIPEKEFEETIHKASAMLRAIDEAESGDDI